MSDESSADGVIRDHRRQWRRCLYVYPVISRRSKGLSIGVNLNPDKRCSFSCVYCQIDRSVHRNLSDVDIEILADELHLALEEAVSGGLWREERFRSTPPEMRRVNDIALSGDGEPTCLGEFDRAVEAAVAAKRDLGRDDIKVIVITNASQLDRPHVKRGLDILHKSGGEIWAKLDAGTEGFFRRVNRPAPGLTLSGIVANIASVAGEAPVVIQSLFFRWNGESPSSSELEAYTERLREIVAAGGKIRLVQIHTVARSPAERGVQRLGDEELERIADRVRMAIPGVEVETYPGQDVPPQL